MHNLWTEKYRPVNFNDIKGQEKIVARVKAFVKQKNMPHLLFAGPAGVGKCICPNTFILDGYGNLLTIEQAYHNKIKSVMSLDRNGKISKKRISYFYRGFSNKMYNIKTSFGANIDVTPEHPFLVLDNGRLRWVQAKDLKEDMHIASPELLKNRKFKHVLKIPKRFIKIEDYYSYFSRNGQYSSKIKIPRLNEEFYYWLGLLFGDGNFRNATIRFYNTNDFLRDIFRDLSYKIFGDKIEIIDVKPKNKCPYIEIRKATTIVKLVEENLGYNICRKKSSIIKVPGELYTSDLRNISSFIKGLYETDGSYYSSCMEISSMSKELLIGLRYLLLKFSIYSRIKKNRILISGSNMIYKFDEAINPSIKKNTKLKKDNTNIDILTINVEDIRLLLKNFGISYEEIGDNFSYIIESRRGSRKNVLIFYKKLKNIIKKRIKNGIEAVSFLNNAEKLKINPDAVFDLLKEYKIRKDIKIIRYDRLKDYYNRKRAPNLKNYLRIIKKLQEIKIYSSEEYINILNILSARQRVLEILNIFDISYNEIANNINLDANSINYTLNNDGLSVNGLSAIKNIFSGLKDIIESRIFNEKSINILENLDFLINAKIIWDVIKRIEIKGGSVVYDLNVDETHNFIGGNSPLILHNTSLVLVAAKELYGDNWGANILDLNASDERGIDVIRNQIKDFARTKAIGNVPFKITILDEADALTKEAQHALRRTMENYSSTCRFCLIVNYSSKIIDPIQSRCAIFRFKPLEEKDIRAIIKVIEKGENIKIDDKAVNAVYQIAQGDVRKIENILQSCAAVNNNITEELVYEIASAARPKEVKEVLELAINGNFLLARNKLLDVMLNHGLSGLDVIKQIQKEIWNLDIDNNKKIRLIDKCGDIEFRMVEGSDEFLQLEALLANFIEK